MRKTLYLKFILAYVIFGIFGFIVVTSIVPGMLKQHLTRERSATLYSEATLIANTYAAGLYTNDNSLESVKQQLNILSVFLDSSIC